MNKALICALAVPALAGIGCGGGDETTATVTKAEFISQADAICAKANKETDKEAQQTFSDLGPNEEPSTAEFNKFAKDTLLPSVQAQVNAIDQLPEPSGDEEQIQAVLDAAQDGIDEGRSDPSSLQNGSAFAEANKLAKSYGLKVCGSS